MTAEPDRLLSILETQGAELYALLTRLTLRADVAEDLLQELFLKLRSAAGFREARHPRAYAFRAAMHLAFDWRRTQMPTVPLHATAHEAEPAAAAESALDRLVDAEEVERVLDALPALSELSRQALVLRYLQQHDYADIAQQLGKTEHQVRGLCHKALGQLRALLRPSAKDWNANPR